MDQWNPALRDSGGQSLYGSMYRRVQAVGGQVKGVLWYQGESDGNPAFAGAFLGKFEAFIKAVRWDFKQPTYRSTTCKSGGISTRQTSRNGIECRRISCALKPRFLTPAW